MLKKIKNACIKFFGFVLKNVRNKHYIKMQNKLNISSCSIISSDCLGGIIYSNLGMAFNSPTINLYIDKSDFMCLVENLENFMLSELVCFSDSGKDFPVGKLTYKDNEIKIYFMHYDSFEMAKSKWDERKERIDYDNIYVIQTVADNLSNEDIERFDSLPFANKRLITYENKYGSKNIFVHPMFKNANYKAGDILKYKSLFSKNRHIDDFDYVDFLNTNSNK